METWPHSFAFIASTLATAIISGFIGGKITIFLTNRKEKREALVRFMNRLTSLAYELKVNFRHVGNKDNPFVTKALENLVYNEPLVHYHLVLLEKAQNSLNMALLLSGSRDPAPPATGQNLMKDLSEYLSSQFNVTAPDFTQETTKSERSQHGQ